MSLDAARTSACATLRLSAARIEQAATVIDPVFLNTPEVSFEPLSRELGAEVWLKVETLNPIRSFKGRGTEFLAATLQDETPLVAASAGNFGQGLARASVRRGRRIVMFAAETANPMKVARMRELGAEVTLAGRDFDAAKQAAGKYAERTGFRFVEDGREPAISEGAGTIALELSSGFDTILVPVGNGALINGIGTWMKAASPATKIIGVCAATAPAMAISWRSGALQTTASAETIADGIAVRLPVAEALADMRHTTDDIVCVSEADLREAMRLLLRHTGLLIEPAGIAGIAALIEHRERFRGQRIVTPLCGSNVEMGTIISFCA
jgi:threonine dehydratase